MFTKTQFLDALRRETERCKHLSSKLSPAAMDYRPGEGMRTSLELLQYLSTCALMPTQCLLSGDWSAEARQPLTDWSKAMTAAQFAARMDDQLSQVKRLLDPLSDDDLRKREATLPWDPTPSTLGALLVGTTLGFMTAYRMQLFVYAKASGRPELNTYNCWMGQDPPPPAASA